MNISTLLYILQIIFLIYFGFSVFYLLLFAVSSFFYKNNSNVDESILRKFLILIPAYKEDNVIINTVTEALKQNYPSNLYDIYVIADSFGSNTLKVLNEKDGINCIEVSFEYSTKARSINKALDIITDEYDGVIILDADNIMEANFIKKINIAMSNGEKAIQGHRVAKNSETPFAILDALSEEVNNTIFRKGHVAIGISSALIGSGMAFEYNLYKSVMKKIDTYADEDKELEIKLLLDWNKIYYLNNAVVYDEKVSNSRVFVKQRSRWISSQIFYARTFLFKSFYELFAHSNIDFFDKMIQLILVPRILLLGISFIVTVFSVFFNRGVFLYSWLSVLLVCILAIVLSVPKQFYNRQTLFAIFRLPLGFFMMLLAVFKVKLGHKRLSPTPHNRTDTFVDKDKK